MKAIAEYGVPAQSATPRKDRVVSSLFWLEWRRHRLGGTLAFLFLFPVMVVCGAIEPVGEAIFFWLAFSMAWGIGLGVGRVEWQEGEEEFQLTLPATRTQRYWVKFQVGALLLLATYAIGAVTCLTDWFTPLGELLNMKQFAAADLPPFMKTGPAFLAFAIVAPLATYAECFASSMAVSRRGQIGWVVWLVPFLVAGGALQVFGARWLGASAGWLYAPAFVGYAAWRAVHGARCYARKDAVLDVQTTGTLERRKMLVTAGVVLALGLAAGLAVFLYTRGG